VPLLLLMAVDVPVGEWTYWLRSRRGCAIDRRSMIIALVMVDVDAGTSMRASGIPVRPSGIVVALEETLEMTWK
jgi:hypothetical protein